MLNYKVKSRETWHRKHNLIYVIQLINHVLICINEQ